METISVSNPSPRRPQPLTTQEIQQIMALFGAGAGRQDLPDDWLDQLRQGWEERLDDLYNPPL